MSKNILLIGGIDKTKSLAVSLIKKGYSVTALNNNVDDCKTLADIDGLSVFCGNGTDPRALEAAYASECDIAIALTKKDADNLVICQLCKMKFNVPKTVSLLADIEKTEFFYKMGIDSVVCANSVISNIIEHEAFIDEIAKTVPIGEGRVQIAEVPILSGAPVIGKKLWEVFLPKEVIVGCILRGSGTVIPRGDTQIFEGDTLVLMASGGQENAAIKELTGRDSKK